MDEEDDDDFELADDLPERPEPVAVEEGYVPSRQKIRDQLQSEIEAFLAKGGVIQQVEANVTADPPQKPTNNYGSRSI